MRILQPAEWSKPRGFSHGVEVDASGKWIVLAGQTGGDEKGDYTPDMAAQVGTALKRIIKLLGEAGAGPEHIVRLTWYLTSRSEYETAGAGIGAAWKETLGRNFPPSTLSWTTGPRSRSRSRRSCRAHKKSTRRDRRVDCQSTRIGLARQRDVGAAELAVGAHRDVLLVAGRLQRDVGVEAGGGGEQLIVSAGAATRKGAADIAAGLGPAARDGAAFSLYVGAEVELVRVA